LTCYNVRLVYEYLLKKKKLTIKGGENMNMSKSKMVKVDREMLRGVLLALDQGRQQLFCEGEILNKECEIAYNNITDKIHVLVKVLHPGKEQKV